MATGTARKAAPTPPTAAHAGAAPVAPPSERERHIRRQLSRAALYVKLIDLGSNLALLAIAVLVYLLAIALVDHWLFGLGSVGRVLSLLGLFVVMGVVFGRQLAPLLVRAINPVYAARSLEEAQPTLKNSLINFLMLRGEPTGVKQAVLDAVEQRAAADISRVEVETAVDRGPLIRVGYLLCGVMAIMAAYKILSPKDPFQTAARVLAPWASIARPARVVIDEIVPGDASAYQGRMVQVSANIRGLREGDTVAVFYSTADGQTIERPVPMTPIAQGGLSWSASLPPARGGAGSGEPGGLRQDITYRIVAGDAESPTFRLQAITAPTILVSKVVYDYPRYSRIASQTVPLQGDLRGLEGTRVTLHAEANQPIKSAVLQFGPNDKGGVESIPLQFSGNQAWTTLTLQLLPDRVTPWRSSYQLRFTNEQGQTSDQPIIHRIDVLADLPPEVEILAPRITPLDIPEDSEQLVELRGVDPDFGLRQLWLRGEVAGQEKLAQALLQPPETPAQATVKFAIRPRDLGLKAGDELLYRAVAEDNRAHPLSGAADPNRTETAPQILRITAAIRPRQPNHNPNPNQPPRPGDPPQAQPQNPAQPANPNQPNPNQPNQQNPSDPAAKPQDPNRPQPNPANANPPGANPQNPNDPNQNPPPNGQPMPNPTENPPSESAKPNPPNQPNEQPNPNQQQPKDNNQQQSQNQQSGGQKGGEQQSGGQQSGGQQSGGQQSGGQQSGGQQSGGQQNSGQQSGGQQSGGQQNSGQQSGGQQSGGQQSGGQQSGGAPQSGGQQASGGQPTGGQPGGDPQAGTGSASQTGGQQSGAPANGPQPKPEHDGERFEEVLKHLQEQEQKQGGQAGQNPQNAANGNQPGQSGQQQSGQQPTGQQPAGQPQSAGGQQSGQNPSGTKSGGQPKAGAGGKAGGQQPGAKPEAGNQPGAQQPGAQQPGAQQGQPVGGNQPGGKPEGGQPGAAPGEKGGGPSPAAGQEKPQQQPGGQPSPQSPAGKKPGDQPGANQGAGGQNQADSKAGGSPMGQDKTDSGQKADPKSGDPKDPGAGQNGTAGAGKPTDDPKGSGATQGASRDAPKQTDPGAKKSEGGEPSPPSDGKRQSNSKGGASGDRSGGGSQGAGQTGGAPGNDSAGGNTPADEGAGAAKEQGSGETGPKAGNQKTAAGKTGKSGDQQGDGSSTRPGPSGQEKGASGEPGEGVASGDQAGDQPGGGKAGPQGKAPGPGTIAGGGRPGERPLSTDPTPQRDDQADAANLEYARRTTDLALQRLKEQQHDPDPALLDRLQMSPDELRDFISRWEALKQAAEKQPGGDRNLDEALRSLGLRDPKLSKRAGGAASDNTRGLRDSGARSLPPSKYREQFQQFRQNAGRLGN